MDFRSAALNTHAEFGDEVPTEKNLILTLLTSRARDFLWLELSAQDPPLRLEPMVHIVTILSPALFIQHIG
jgi:hypothetical protein